MLIGIGSNRQAKTVRVQWPSGKTQEVSIVPAATLLTFYENPDHSPEPTPVTRTRYVRPIPLPESMLAVSPSGRSQLSFSGVTPFAGSAAVEGRRRLVLYTTTATWCPACKRHLPRLRQLRSQFGDEALAMYGIPIDESDTSEKLARYVKQHRPSYQLLNSLSAEQRSQVQRLLAESLRTNALPATIVTDERGAVLLVTPGIPNASRLRALAAMR